MDYYELTVECNSTEHPIVEALLEVNLIKGWTEEDTKSGKKLIFYLPQDITGEERIKSISKELSKEGLSLLQTILKGEEWEHTWKKNFKTRQLEKIIVTPPWLPYTPKDGEYVIEIEPGMAFGTGDHATTALCILLLQHYQKKGQSMLDLGTGSGILAMASKLLGAQKVVGIDNDSIAVTEAIENLKKNNLYGKVDITLGNAHEEIKGDYDVICANLFLHQVESILKSGIPYLKNGGIFIGSGITSEQREKAEKCVIESGFELLEVRQEGMWIAFAATESR